MPHADCSGPVPRPTRLIGRFCLPLLVLLTVPGAVSRAKAQAVESGAPAALRQWDVSGGVGPRFFDGASLGDQYSSWTGAWQARVQLGRYLTPHLKAEITASSPLTYESYPYEPVILPGQSAPVSAFSVRRSRVFSVTPLVTYQFFENAFVHPFVSTGLSIGFLDETTTRPRQTLLVNNVTTTIPAAGGSREAVLLRPVIAAGFKTYFNERVFVRPETELTLTGHGVTQVGLRLDVGLDF
jgi:hypothetical protein